MRVEESIEINRPLQEVFDYVSDVGNYPEWMAHALEVLKDTEGPPQQKDRFIVAIKSVGRRFETPYERTSYEANRQYADQAVGGPTPTASETATVTADFSVVDPHRMMRTYGPAEGYTKLLVHA